MAKSFASIDTGNDTEAARNYAARASKLLASLDSNEVSAENLESNPTTTFSTPKPSTKEIASVKPALVEALGLQESHELVEIILNFTAPNDTNAVFSVTVKPIAINITDDCVTLLIDSSINIKPPTLLALKIKKSNITYPVVYAGTILQTPKLNVLSFLRTTL